MRDSDLDWSLIGESEPFWGVLTHDRYRSDKLDDKAIEEFYATGVADVEHVVARLRASSGMPEKIGRVCDFGSGVGRLSFALAKYAGEVVGIDISEGMRKQAAHWAARRNVLNVSFAAEIPDTGFDWVNSFIVLQHIPPARGYALIQKLVNAVSPGGLLSLQLTYAQDKRYLDALLGELTDYAYDGETVRKLVDEETHGAGHMKMFAYDLNRVFRILHRKGMSKVWTEHTDHGGCHGVWLFARA